MFCDTHCHLDYFEKSLHDTIINDAIKHNTKILINISTKVSKFDSLELISKSFHQVKKQSQKDADIQIYSTIGNHPEHIDEEESLDINKIYMTYKDNKNIVAVGETGLDYYYTKDNKSKQIEEFLKHIQLAKKFNIPIVIHAREAWDDIIRIIKDSITPSFTGKNFILHCFTGSKNEVYQLNDLDCYISISGIVTFKNAVNIQESINYINENRLIAETDSPFLAPVPFRGKQNYPHYVKYVVECINKIKNKDLTDTIYKNSMQAFKIL